MASKSAASGSGSGFNPPSPKRPRVETRKPALRVGNFDSQEVSAVDLFCLFNAIGPVERVIFTPGTIGKAEAQVVMSFHSDAYKCMDWANKKVFTTKLSVSTMDPDTVRAADGDTIHRFVVVDEEVPAPPGN